MNEFSILNFKNYFDVNCFLFKQVNRGSGGLKFHQTPGRFASAQCPNVLIEMTMKMIEIGIRSPYW